MYELSEIRLSNALKVATFCCLLVFGALLVASCAQTKRENKTTDLWNVLRDHSVSSVVWSPKGDHIAFVAAGYKDDTDDGLLRASIWIASMSRRGQIEKIGRLITLTRKQGIPAALFWVDSNRVGWAASRTSSFGFMQMSLASNKPEPLVSQSFRGFQGTGDSGPWSAPDDVYYDTVSRSLLFSAALPPGNEVYVRILPLGTKKARTLHVPPVKGLAHPIISNVTLCGSLSNLNEPEFYLAAWMLVHTYEGGGCYLWHSTSYSLHQDNILTTSPHQGFAFPRTSPDRKLLAYLRSPGERKPDELVLRDPNSGKQRVLGILQSRWKDLSPAIGCPFSWSPDGKAIAYADGSKIKTVKVERCE